MMHKRDYTGVKEKDAESGLYYYGARYYAAWTCRFISIDPLASKYPNLSGYLYAYNNPIMMNDPTGMEGEKGGGSEQANNTTTQNTQVHSVKSGETLSKIAEQYGTTVDALAQTNNISDPDYIQAGQKLNIGGISKDSDNISLNYDWGDSSSFTAELQSGTYMVGVTDSGNATTKSKDNHTTIIGSVWAGSGGPTDSTGKTDWTVSPNSRADAPAKPHDWTYEQEGLEGISGVFFNTNETGIAADKQFVKEELKVIRGYFRGETDPYKDNEQITFGTAFRATIYIGVIGSGAVFKEHLKMAEDSYNSMVNSYNSMVNKTTHDSIR